MIAYCPELDHDIDVYQSHKWEVTIRNWKDLNNFIVFYSILAIRGNPEYDVLYEIYRNIYTFQKILLQY